MDAPDFQPAKKGVTFNWELNIPAMLYAIAIFGGGVIAYSNFQVDRNDVKWEAKVQAADIEALKKSQEATAAAIRALSESIATTNRTVDHLSQVMEWNQQHPQKP